MHRKKCLPEHKDKPGPDPGRKVGPRSAVWDGVTIKATEVNALRLLKERAQELGRWECKGLFGRGISGRCRCSKQHS